MAAGSVIGAVLLDHPVGSIGSICGGAKLGRRVGVRAGAHTIMLRFQRGELIGRPRTPAALSAAAAWRPVRSSALCSSTTPAAASARSVVARDSVGGSACAQARTL